MCELLGELDRGPVSIAPGSKVTLFNLQTGEAVLTKARPTQIVLMLGRVVGTHSGLVIHNNYVNASMVAPSDHGSWYCVFGISILVLDIYYCHLLFTSESLTRNTTLQFRTVSRDPVSHNLLPRPCCRFKDTHGFRTSRLTICWAIRWTALPSRGSTSESATLDCRP